MDYDDIINKPHHTSSTHTPMSMSARAAQFAPFSALRGFDELMDETARETDKRISLSEDTLELLDRKLAAIANHIPEKIEITISHFARDLSKDGGAYISHTGVVSKIDSHSRYIVFEDGTTVNMDDIISMHYFNALDKSSLKD